MADSINKVGDERDNVITGGHGDDVLSGYGGHDTIHGGNRHDILNGGEGDDDLYGGSGADRFELVLYGSRDHVTDFSVSQGDKIRIDTANGTEDSFQELGLGISGNTSVTHLQHQGEIVMTLSGIDASDVIIGSFNTYFDVV